MTVWYDSAALQAQTTSLPRHNGKAGATPCHGSLHSSEKVCARCHSPELTLRMGCPQCGGAALAGLRQCLKCNAADRAVSVYACSACGHASPYEQLADGGLAAQPSQRDQLIAGLHRLKSTCGAMECAVLMVRIDIDKEATGLLANVPMPFNAVCTALQPLGDVFRFGQCFLVCVQDSKEAVEDSILHIRALVQATLDERVALKLDVFALEPVLATLER